MVRLLRERATMSFRKHSSFPSKDPFEPYSVSDSFLRSAYFCFSLLLAVQASSYSRTRAHLG